MPSSINPEFKRSANSWTDFIPSPGSETSLAKFIVLPFANVRLSEVKSFKILSETLKVAEDWFPIEFKFIDLTDPGIEDTTPSFKNEVAKSGFEDLVKTSSIFGGRNLSWINAVFPRSFNSTEPTFWALAEIKFLEAAAKSLADVRLNLKAPARVLLGDISTISPSSGFPIIWTSRPSNDNLLPWVMEIPLDELTSQLFIDFINLAVMFSWIILFGFPITTSKSNLDLLYGFATGTIELVENIDFPWFPFKSIPDVWISLNSRLSLSANALISLCTSSTKL